MNINANVRIEISQFIAIYQNFAIFSAHSPYVDQEPERMRLTGAVFGKTVVDMHSLLDAIPPEQKAAFDGDFLIAIAEQPNEILKSAMYLFMGYLEAACRCMMHDASSKFIFA